MASYDDPITLSSDSEEEVRPAPVVPPVAPPADPPVASTSASVLDPQPSTSRAFSVKSGSSKQNGVEKRVTRSQNEEAIKRVSRTLKGLKVAEQFMGAFDPENSNRERRKLSRFDPNKKQMPPELEICDCLIVKCRGCFFPCPTCESPKCGPICRNNRTYHIHSMGADGSQTERYHPSLHNKDP